MSIKSLYVNGNLDFIVVKPTEEQAEVIYKWTLSVGAKIHEGPEGAGKEHCNYGMSLQLRLRLTKNAVSIQTIMKTSGSP